ncbi:mycofactocin precursor MftA [Saccharopolyspora sp. SCSIO 74807]
MSEQNSAEQPPAEDIENDVLVEEVSIDGMCGVY